MMAYNCFKDQGDEDEAEKYKQRMDAIVSGQTAADGDEMPGLTDANNQTGV